MDGNPTGPAPTADAAAEREEDRQPSAQAETFGVLELTRRNKDDGRALLVFRRSAPTA